MPIKTNDIKSVPMKIDNLYYFLNDFTHTLEQYKIILKKIETSEKFIENTINNLRNIQNYFLQNNKLPTNILYNQNTNDIIRQKGNCFKKWSKLSADERSDRFLSYSTYYIDKRLIITQLIDSQQRDKLIVHLHNYLLNLYEQKLLKYKYIKWNIKSGIIDNIAQVHYNMEKSDFEFTGIIEPIKKNSTVKRKSITKTIFTQENEKIINDEILLFILKEKQSSLEISDDKKEQFYETIKSKLKLKRIFSKDKEQINLKYNEILNVVSKNQV